MRQKNFIWYIIAGILIFLGGSYFFGQSYKTIESNLISNSSLNTNQNLDQQVRVLKDTQNELVQIKEKTAQANKVVEKNKIEISELSTKSKSQKAEIEKLNQAIVQNQTKYDELKKELDQAKLSERVTIQEKRIDLQKIINQTQERIKVLESTELENKLLLTQKEASQEAALTNASELQKILTEKSDNLNGQLNMIVNGSLALFQNYAIYFVLLVIYWLVYKSLLYWLSKNVNNYSIRTGLKITFRIIWILISSITVIYALANQFSYILTSLGFVSAALVFALQNFVSSFFVFILLSITKNIKDGDIVKVGPDGESSLGKIIKVGYLFTLLKEIDSETFEEAGRTISIPNNYFLTHPISNFTFVNRVVWQSLEIATKQTADYKKCKSILENLVDEKYNWMIKNKSEYLEVNIDIELFKPKVIMSIDERGYVFTIHLSCKYNKYNEVFNDLLIQIIDELTANNIEIAFKN
jgi:small-conductance mechanosensitive channel